MSNETVFAKIINREIPAVILYEDEWVVAFNDVNPQAPVHILVVPREPVRDLTEASPELLGRLFHGVCEVARARGLEGSGFRTVINTGVDAGQTVPHLHAHILAGRQFSWPPG